MTDRRSVRSAGSSGFTIVELLIVIVVIAILAAITIVAYRGIQDRARESTVKSDLSQAAKQLAIDKTLTGSFPTTVNADGSGNANEGKGLKVSDGTALQYAVNNSANPPTFCLTAVNASQVFHVAPDGVPAAGACSGHSGIATDDGSSISCDSGFVPVPGNSQFGTSDFCVAKYEAKNSGGTAVSQAAGTPWVNISQTSAISTASSACAGCHLITEAEWLTVAHNVLNVSSNWSGGSVGNGYIYSGHNDMTPANTLAASTDDGDSYYGTGNTSGNQRRTLTLSNGEVIWDLAGNVSEWTSGQTSGGQPGASGYTYREWNVVEGTGSLSPNPFPSFGTPVAVSWASAQGIGRLYSNADETAIHGFYRGGSFNFGSSVGVFTLYLNNSTDGNWASIIGFRLAR